MKFDSEANKIVFWYATTVVSIFVLVVLVVLLTIIGLQNTRISELTTKLNAPVKQMKDFTIIDLDVNDKNINKFCYSGNKSVADFEACKESFKIKLIRVK